MLQFAYRTLTNLCAPAISLYLLKRRMEGREDKERFKERLGVASIARPEGRLVWCHAASVGEAASILILIEKLFDTYPGTNVLVTTGTVTSAKMLAGRLPQHAFHQFIPVDRAPYVKKFLDHWKPDFVLWIESELWPNMLAGLRERETPAVLLNARMSEKSFRNWYRVKSWIKTLLGTFVLCLTQTEDERARFVALGAAPVRCFGNLKYAAKPLPADEQQLTMLKYAIADRPRWVFASTHRGEDEMAIAAHKKLREKYPNILTTIVPRHPTRGNDIAETLTQSGIKFAQRWKGQEITKDTGIYLADTMGELGIFYRLNPIACIGGSFMSVGGHNPVEAAQLECAVIFGPYMYNFQEIAREFTHQKAAIQLQNANEIAFTVDRLLSNPNERLQFSIGARALADQKRHVLDQILQALEPWLKTDTRRAA
ncbi:MAG TPA: 3-deoxy-D-manno-octulosonic acid transferase [Alphaproteobacteria bacterium]|nr:3-deoxy-D-manno-octulosonic acid transferase [Alphaproteobacteria bacterium]